MGNPRSIRFPDELDNHIEALAKKKQRSFSRQVVYLIQQATAIPEDTAVIDHDGRRLYPQGIPRRGSSRAPARTECSRAAFHRAGQFCKTCGSTP